MARGHHDVGSLAGAGPVDQTEHVLSDWEILADAVNQALGARRDGLRGVTGVASSPLTFTIFSGNRLDDRSDGVDDVHLRRAEPIDFDHEQQRASHVVYLRRAWPKDFKDFDDACQRGDGEPQLRCRVAVFVPGASAGSDDD